MVKEISSTFKKAKNLDKDEEFCLDNQVTEVLSQSTKHNDKKKII
jgi:hypothetical protein